MKAMLLRKTGPVSEASLPLGLAELPDPVPGPGEIVIRVSACGVCHTELDEIEGRTPPPDLPVIPGHEVIGRVSDTGAGCSRFRRGDRVGVGWIFSACGRCRACRSGQENLCPDFRATGRDSHGGYAEQMVVREEFAFPIPEIFSDAQAAPLMCAGAIGYRSLRLAGMRDGDRLGLTGFGASAHLVLKLTRTLYPGSDIYVFARSPGEREFAMDLGSVWAGDTTDTPPEKLHAIIDTTPVWKPVVEALGNLAPGGRLVINAIRKESADKDYLLNIDYPRHIWMEKEIKSVANVARSDINDFLKIAARIPITPAVEEYPLEEANRALIQLKAGHLKGAKVLMI